MQVRRITLLLSKTAADHVILHTDLPPSCWPWKEAPTLTLHCAAETGAQYCELNFPGVPVEIVKTGG
jgi:hypothetical protein